MTGTVTQDEFAPRGRTDSEAWRRECEARHVLALPAMRRLLYLGLVREARGDEAWMALCGDVETMRNEK